MIPRYTDPEIAQVCRDQARYDRWVRVELAALTARAPVGQELTWLRKHRPLAMSVRRYERENGHEMLAFLYAWRHEIDSVVEEKPTTPEMAQDREWARRIHQHLTSSDVQDTALSLELLAITARVTELAAFLKWQFGRLASIEQEQIGRTHGQWATVRTFGHPWGVLARMCERMLGRLAVSRRGIALCKLAGPVGTSGLNMQQQLSVAEQLGLHLVQGTQVIPRDGLSAWAHVLSDLATMCEAIATQVWLLAQSGIDEVREGGTPVGSSSMPHKRNPVKSENIRGLARMARSRAAELQLGIVQWGDHDLSHSSVERVSIPDLAHLVCTALDRTATLLAELKVFPDALQSNVDAALESGSGSYEGLNSAVEQGQDYLTVHHEYHA